MTDNFDRSFDRAVDVPKRTFASLEIAQQARDIIKQAAGQVVNTQIGRPSIARVISVDFVARKANVWFPGDQAPVPVNIFSSVLPGVWQSQYPDSENTSYAGYGSMAVIESFNGKPYITQILSGGQFAIDHQSAGRVDVAFDEDGNPTTPTSADYSFRMKWNTDQQTVQESIPYSFDTFDNRTLVGEWGSAESGQPYEVVELANSSIVSVENGTGRVSVGSSDFQTIILLPESRADSYETFELIAPQTVGDSVFVNRVFRYRDVDNFHYVEFTFRTNLTIQMRVVKRVAGASTTHNAIDLSGTYVSGDRYKCETLIQGTSVKIKAWKSTENKPLDWQINYTAPDSLPGRLGVRCDVGSLSGFPVLVQWDNIQSQSVPETSALPHYGGPYAIKIGPFMNPDGTMPQNSTHEIDLLHDTGAGCMYSFTFNPYHLFKENLTQSQIDNEDYLDRWFRVIPDKINEDNYSMIAGAAINNTVNFDDGLGEWTKENATTEAVASLDLGTPAMRLKSTDGITTSIAAGTPGGFDLYRVFEFSKYEISFEVYSPSAWAGGVSTDVQFYDSPTDPTPILRSSSNTTLNAATWTSFTYSFTSPSGTHDRSRFIVKVNGTPPSGQLFYFRNIKYKNMGGRGKTEFNLELALRKTIHGATDVNLSNSPGELWLRIYIAHLNAIQNPIWTLRYRATGGWTQIRSLRTGKPVYEYDTNAVIASGYLGFHDAGVGFTSTSNTYKKAQVGMSSGVWRNPDLLAHSRMQLVLNGGVRITWNGTYLKWSQPFYITNVGSTHNGANYPGLEIPCPAAGIQIPAFPSGGLATVDANGVPVFAGESLWIGIAPGFSPALGETLPATFQAGGLNDETGFFRIDQLYRELWAPPEWAILIAARGISSDFVKLGTGQVIFRSWDATFYAPNAWSGTFTARHINDENQVILEGVLTPGTSQGNGAAVAQLPLSGLRPLTEVAVPVMISSGSTVTGGLSPHFRIDAAGWIYAYGCASATQVKVNATYMVDR